MVQKSVDMENSMQDNSAVKGQICKHFGTGTEPRFVQFSAE